MAKITELTLKTLCEVLKQLRGGSIGFDPFRDDRTNTKAKLLAFILKEHSNEEIIKAIATVSGEASAFSMSTGIIDAPDADQAPVVVTFKDLNAADHVIGFMCQADAQAYIGENPTNRYTGRFTQAEYQALKQSTTMPKLSPKLAADAINATLKKNKPAETATPEAAQIAALLASMASKGAVDESKVREICDQRAQEYVDNILEATNARLNAYDAKIDALQMPVTVHVLKPGDVKAVDLGHQHVNFATLLKMAQARTKDGMRLNIWLKGPAGSGKTTAAKKVSEALEMQFQFNGAISTEYELMGFKDASGAYHRTAFREVFENGGVYLFDEVDSSLPKAVLAFNAALANGECRFPDAMINRHKDCVIIAGANTAGNGANSDYVGRMKQDLAFLNRFVMLDWPLDESLEKALASNKDWVRKVQKFRSNAVKRSIKGHIISPRATFYGEALLAAGLSEEIVEQAVLRGALTNDQWASLCQ